MSSSEIPTRPTWKDHYCDLTMDFSLLDFTFIQLNVIRNQISFGVLGQHESQSESGVMMGECIYSLMLKSTETEQSTIWLTFAIYRLLTKEGRDLM